MTYETDWALKANYLFACLASAEGSLRVERYGSQSNREQEKR